jgi:hypothetical protein
MDHNPVMMAIAHLGDAKRILQELNTSWENFDYAAARSAINELDAKIKFLERLEAQFAATSHLPAEPLSAQ